MRLKLTRRHELKLKTSTRLPAQLVGGTATTVTRANGVYTIDVDTTEVADLLAPTVLNRANHTGTQPASTISDLATAILDRSQHTGTQLASTISDFSEATDDRVSSLLTAGNGITKSYNDGAGTLTVGLRDLVSVLDYIPVAEHAAILAQTTTYDATAAIQACIDANGGIRPIHVPSGKYIITDTLKFRPVPVTVFAPGLELCGDGPTTVFENRVAADVYSHNFATTNSSVTVTVTHNAHPYAAGDVVEMTGTSGPIGGLTFDGIWSITSVTANTYTFASISAASSTANGSVTYAVVNPMIDIGVTDSLNNWLQFSHLSHFKITNDTALTRTLGIRLRKAYHCTVDNVWIIAQNLDAIQIPSVDETAGDRDASNQVTIDHCRIENCARWGIWVVGRSETAGGGGGGNNENSYVKITNTFMQGCGVDAATTPPVSGGIRWKGQILNIDNSAVAASNNVALWLEGGNGLANSATITGFTSENVTRKGIYIDGIQQASFRDIQLYNNDGFVAQYGIRIDGTNFPVSNIRVSGVVVRATSGNNAYTAFSLTGANADEATCRVDRRDVVWANFDHAGQTRWSGWGVEHVHFVAHKNSTDQTGIVSATPTKVTFGTEVFDDEGFYNTTDSRWVPPPGRVRLFARAYVSAGVVDQAQSLLMIYKNGSLFRNIDIVDSSGTSGFQLGGTVMDDANGTDYYEVWINGGGAGNKTVNGAATHTFFEGQTV